MLRQLAAVAGRFVTSRQMSRGQITVVSDGDSSSRTNEVTRSSGLAVAWLVVVDGTCYAVVLRPAAGPVPDARDRSRDQ